VQVGAALDVVQTEPKKEAKVADALNGSEFDVFAPTEPKRIRVNAVACKAFM
jgi:hypothetical protein